MTVATAPAAMSPVESAPVSYAGIALDIDLWWLDLTWLPTDGEQHTLSADEQARAARFHFERDRRRYVAAHVLMRRLLGDCTGQRPADLRFEQGAFGKPQWAGGGPGFNLSHSGDVGLLGIDRLSVGAGSRGVGVDVEVLRGVNDIEALSRLNFVDRECEALSLARGEERDRAFLTVWTRKEACLKAPGFGLQVAPRSFECGAHPALARVSMHAPGGEVTLDVDSVVDRDGVVAAVARCR